MCIYIHINLVIIFVRFNLTIIDHPALHFRTLLRQHSSALDLTDLSKALLDENERNTPQRTRAIHGQLTLPDDKFTDQLQNPQSAEYAAKKTAIEEMV